MKFINNTAIKTLSNKYYKTTMLLSAKHKSRTRKFVEIWERFMEAVFFTSACVAILSVILITFYLFIKGTPAIFEIGPVNFIFGTKWKPNQNIFGIFPMIVASIYGSIGAIIIGVPIGLFTAVFLSEIAPSWLAGIFRPAIELLAGIPSVVYGFFGLIVIVPLISKNLGGPGNSLLAMIFILAVMILPTIIKVSESSIRAVPESYKEGSLALGATHIQTIFNVLIPAARSGIIASIVLGIGRAIGETMAVILICGNTALIPDSILDPVRPLTSNIALEMAYAFGLHQEALFGTGVILFIFIMAINIIFNVLAYKTGDA